MGKRCDWRCTTGGCSTIVQEVSGGWDRSFYAITETRICMNCKHIQDYKVGVAQDGFLDQGTPGKETKPTQKAHEDPNPSCSRCGGETELWDRKCPACDCDIKPTGNLILWD